MNSLNGLDDANASSPQWGAKKALIATLATVVISALVGSILGLGLAIAHRPSELAELTGAATAASMFGAWVGLVIGLLFGSVRKLRQVGTGSRLRRILVFGFLGAIAGALLLFPFSQGLAMALYLAIEGAVAGGLMGLLLGLLTPRFWPS
jgi:hypothetical protein